MKKMFATMNIMIIMKSQAKNNMPKYYVSYENQIGKYPSFGESETFNTLEEAEDWVRYNLPYGVQKCRTGSYEILEEE
jgi:hypothetical protein